MREHLNSFPIETVIKLQKYFQDGFGFLNLYAPEGTGKSLLLQGLIDAHQRSQKQYEVHYAHAVENSGESLIEEVQVENSRIQLKKKIQSLISSNKSTVLMIDDADNLSSQQLQNLLMTRLKKLKVLLVTREALGQSIDRVERMEQISLPALTLFHLRVWAHSLVPIRFTSHNLQNLLKISKGQRRPLAEYFILLKGQEGKSLSIEKSFASFFKTQLQEIHSDTNPGEIPEQIQDYEQWRWSGSTQKFHNRDLANLVEEFLESGKEELLGKMQLPKSSLLRIKLQQAQSHSLQGKVSESVLAMQRLLLQEDPLEEFEYWSLLEVFLFANMQDSIYQCAQMMDQRQHGSLNFNSSDFLNWSFYLGSLQYLNGNLEASRELLSSVLPLESSHEVLPQLLNFIRLLSSCALLTLDEETTSEVRILFESIKDLEQKNRFAFENGFFEFLHNCLKGNHQIANGILEQLNEKASEELDFFRLFYAGYLMQKLQSPWTTTEFELPVPASLPVLEARLFSQTLAQLEKQFDQCVCDNGDWTTVSKSTLLNLTTRYQEYDLYLNFSESFFWEKEIGEIALDKSRVSQLLLLILAFNRNQRYSYKQLFEAVYSKEFDSEVDDPTIRMAIKRLKKKIEPVKDSYLTQSVSTGEIFLREQATILIVLPDSEVHHFRRVLHNVKKK